MIRLIVEGPPRTKKNHGKVIKRGTRTFHVQSDAARTWELSAVLQLRAACRYQLQFGGPVSVQARVYRDANRGDLVGYLQAIGDALERGGVITNDVMIQSWDGSRLYVDRERPRVEITLEAMP